MGILDKLRGADKERETPTIEAPCLHTALLPRWDSVDDMGKEDRVDHWWCEGCGQNFSPEEAEGLKHTNTLEMIGPPPEVTRTEE